MVQDFRHTYVDDQCLINCRERERESLQMLRWKIVAEKHSMQNYAMQDIL